MIAESGLNDPRVMRDRAVGGWGCDAAWADDFHHALRALLTDERDGYYEEFGSVAAAGQGVAPPPRPRRDLLELSPPALRRAGRRRAARPVRRLRPEPRPGRQPRVRRPAAGAGSAAGRLLHAALAVRAAAVHGRGVRRGRAVPVLLRPHRPEDRRGHPRGPARGVRRVRLVRRGGDPRPAGPGDVRALEADAPTRSGARRAVRATARGPPAPAARRSRRDRVRRGGALAAGAARARSSWSRTSAPSRARCRAGVPRWSWPRTARPTIGDGMVELEPMSGALVV